jgi:hypothetical protein
MEVWQVPAPATPHIKAPVRIAGLRGRNLALVEHRVLRRLAKARIKLGCTLIGERQTFPLDDDFALNLGLLLRILAPMRNREYMRACAEHRRDGPRGGRLLARHGHAPQIPPTRANGPAFPADRP